MGYATNNTQRGRDAEAVVPVAGASTIIAAEIARFEALSQTWWNPRGPLRPLHVTNGLRVDYLLTLIEARFARQAGTGLAGLRVLDVGCGAGLAAEPLARRGAAVVGIDAAVGNIEAARRHAAAEGLVIDYRVGEPVQALASGERFDVILLLEVVEHVADVPAFVQRVGAHLTPGGLLVASTINRTLRSFVIAILGAEYLLRLLPRGTHRWRQLVKPAELTAAAAAAGLQPLEQRGMRYLPVLHRAAWTRDCSVNYIAAYGRSQTASSGLPDLT
jgi:2-polyprenyl-6-hydroxyphenyl methylase/3-demethylubiquinone-9 3-methyltransferase